MLFITHLDTPMSKQSGVYMYTIQLAFDQTYF